MSESIFETFTDERGNISVRISQEVQVLTREEANRIEAEYRRMQAENAKLRELVLHMVECVRRLDDTSEDGGCSLCPYQSIDYDCEFENRARELGVEVPQ